MRELPIVSHSLDQAKRLWGSASVGPAPARPAVAILVSRFPVLCETVVLREIGELERQGQRVRLVPLARERPALMHREAEAWLPHALFTPFLSRAIVAANARALARRPLRYGLVVARVALGALRSPRVLVRTLRLVPKCVYLAEQLEREGVRHVHAHYATHPATAAFIICSLAPISMSFTVHGRDLFVGWRRPLLAAKVRRAGFIRATSTFTRSFLAALHPESAAKIRIIPAGVDPAAYRPRAARRAQATEDDGHEAPAPRLLAVAVLEPYKGVQVLIEACGRLEAAGIAFRCDIVGEGSERESLAAAIAGAALDERVRLLGALRQDEVASLLCDAAIAVLPSVMAPQGPMQGVPVALLEAMAAGRPVIAPAVAAIPEVVEHGVTGLLVEPGNVGALTDAIAVLLLDPRRARALGRRGRARVLDAFRLDECTAALLRQLDLWNPPAGITRSLPRRRQLKILDALRLGDPAARA